MVYKRSYQPMLEDMAEMEEPCIIVATNLAGRGTDLKISETLSKKVSFELLFWEKRVGSNVMTISRVDCMSC